MAEMADGFGTKLFNHIIIDASPRPRRD